MCVDCLAKAFHTVCQRQSQIQQTERHSSAAQNKRHSLCKAWTLWASAYASVCWCVTTATLSAHIGGEHRK